MIEPLRWNTLEEAADWLTEKTGKPWTPRRILDAGEQGLINVRAVLPPGTRVSASDDSIFNGNTIKLDGVYLDYLLKHESVVVTATCDIPYSRSPPSGDHEVDFKLTPPALIAHGDLGVSGIDLEAAGDTLIRPTPSATRSKPETNSRPWQDAAREIADELYSRAAASGYYDTLKHLSDKVAEEMRERKIFGPLGPLSGGTVRREALQGDMWWQCRQKRNMQRIADIKSARETGEAGEAAEAR